MLQCWDTSPFKISLKVLLGYFLVESLHVSSLSVIIFNHNFLNILVILKFLLKVDRSSEEDVVAMECAYSLSYRGAYISL